MKKISAPALAVLLVGAAGCAFFSSSEPKAPVAETTATVDAASAPVSSAEAAPSSEASPSAAAPEQVEAPKPTKTFALTDFKLPLSIDLPEGSALEQSKSKDNLGGASVDTGKLRLRVMRADARLATSAAAKVSLQKKVMDAAKSFVKEEPDLFVYTMGNGFLSFLVLVKVGGVMYACDGPDAEREEELTPGITACRTIKKAK